MNFDRTVLGCVSNDDPTPRYLTAIDPHTYRVTDTPRGKVLTHRFASGYETHEVREGQPGRIYFAPDHTTANLLHDGLVHQAGGFPPPA